MAPLILRYNLLLESPYAACQYRSVHYRRARFFQNFCAFDNRRSGCHDIVHEQDFALGNLTGTAGKGSLDIFSSLVRRYLELRCRISGSNEKVVAPGDIYPTGNLSKEQRTLVESPPFKSVSMQRDRADQVVFLPVYPLLLRHQQQTGQRSGKGYLAHHFKFKNRISQFAPVTEG